MEARTNPNVQASEQINTSLKFAEEIYWGDREAKDEATKTIWDKSADAFRDVLLLDPNNLIALDWLVYLYEHHKIAPLPMDFADGLIPKSHNLQCQTMREQLNQLCNRPGLEFALTQVYQDANRRQLRALQKDITSNENDNIQIEEYLRLSNSSIIHIDDKRDINCVEHHFKDPREAKTFATWLGKTFDAWLREQNYPHHISIKKIRSKRIDSIYYVELTDEQFDAIMGNNSFDSLLTDDEVKKLRAETYNIASYAINEYNAKELTNFLESKVINQCEINQKRILKDIFERYNVNNFYSIHLFCHSIIDSSIELQNLLKSMTVEQRRMALKTPRMFFSTASKLSADDFVILLKDFSQNELDEMVQKEISSNYNFVSFLDENPENANLIMQQISHSARKVLFYDHSSIINVALKVLSASDVLILLSDLEEETLKSLFSYAIKENSIAIISKYLLHEKDWLNNPLESVPPLSNKLIPLLDERLLSYFQNHWLTGNNLPDVLRQELENHFSGKHDTLVLPHKNKSFGFNPSLTSAMLDISHKEALEKQISLASTESKQEEKSLSLVESNELEIKNEDITTIRTAGNQVVLLSDPEFIEKIWRQGISWQDFRLLKSSPLHINNVDLQRVLLFMHHSSRIDTGFNFPYDYFKISLSSNKGIFDTKDPMPLKNLAVAFEQKQKLSILLNDINAKKSWKQFVCGSEGTFFYPKTEITTAKMSTPAAEIKREITQALAKELTIISNYFFWPRIEKITNHWNTTYNAVKEKLYDSIFTNSESYTKDSQAFYQAEQTKLNRN